MAIADESSVLAEAIPLPELDPKKMGLSLDQEKAFPGLVEWLGKKTGGLRELAYCLLGERNSSENFALEIRELVSLLIVELPQTDIDVSLSTLSLLVRYRNRSGRYAIRLPEICVRIPKIDNPFTAERLAGLSKVRRWRKLMIEEIIRDSKPGDQQLAYGRVLASAVLWGGLVSGRSLEALYDLLPHWAEHSTMAHGRISITWTERGSNHKRWFPDALTSLLILRLKLRQPLAAGAAQTILSNNCQAKSAMQRTLLAYFRSDEGGLRGECPKSIPKLLDAALIDMEVRLPRALAQYAAGKQASHSLRPDVWKRLMDGPAARKGNSALARAEPPAESSSEEFAEEVNAAADDTDSTTGNSDTDEPGNNIDWLPNLRTALKSAEKAEKPKALARVKAYLKVPGLPVPAQIFAGFAEALLQQHVKSRKGNTLKTLRTRVIAVATKLPGQIRLEQAASLNGDTLQAAYQAVLEEAISENQRQKLAQHLRAFHHYLVKKRFVENIDEGEAFASADEDLTVDANLIVEDEYQDALIYLSEGHTSGNVALADPLVRKVAKLITMVGYRCGLRRTEALKLQLTDFIDMDPAELLVRPWEQRRLKTPNATRKMPLYALFEDELSEFQEWIAWRQEDNEKRVKEGIDPSPFLFSIPDLDYAFLPEGLVFPLIHDALRAVTNDPSLHFHHLRHAFASWLIYAFMRPPASLELPPPAWLEQWPRAKEWMSKCGQLHASLYGNSFPTRRNLYAIARLLGHSGPAMSLEHYVHVADQLLALWLERQRPLFEPKVWIAASGISIATAYRYLDVDPDGKASGWALVERNWNKIVKTKDGAGKRLSAGGDAPGISAFDASAERDSRAQCETLQAVHNLWLLLYLSATEGTSKEDLGRRFGLSESLVVNLIEVAKEVEQRRSGRKTFLHHFQPKTGRLVDKDHTMQGGQRIACPLRPREGEDIKTVARFVPSLWNLLRSQPESCLTVLKHYLECPRNERNGLEFLPSESLLAKQYLELLHEVGVRPEEVLFARYADKADSDAWRVWHRALCLNGDETVRPATPPAIKKAALNVIGIRVVLVPVNRETDARPMASCGVSYLLVMAGIWSEACSRTGRGHPQNVV